MLRYFLFLFLPASLIVGFVFWSFYSLDFQSEQQVIRTHDTELVQLQKETIAKDFSHVVSDLLFMTHQAERHHIDDEDKWSHLAKHYVVLAGIKKIYDQISFIDAQGMEVVRINYNDGSPSVVPTQKLQQKGHRYYFKNTIGLKRGKVFVSPFDLNMESGEVEQPLKPMIRFSTPVMDKNGEVQGIIIFNYLGEKIIENFILTHLERPDHSLLLNADGYWMHGESANDEWGFMFPEGKNKTFGNTFPQEWQQIKSRDHGQFQTDNGLYTFTTVYPLQKDWSGSDAVSRVYHWKIVSHIPQLELIAATQQYKTHMLQLFAILIVMLAFASWLIARANAKRTLAETGLSESENLFQNMTAQSPYAIQFLSPDGKVTYVNSAFEKLWGLSLEDMKDYNILEDEQTQKLGTAHIIEKAFAGEKATFPTIQYDSQNIAGVGSTRWVEGHIYPVKKNNGELEKVIIMYEDTTDRNIAENKLIKSQERFFQAQKMESMGTLVGGIAHDFNNMLAGITGNLYLAKIGAQGLPDVVRKLDGVEELSFRAAEMIKQLLTFARKGDVTMKPLLFTPFIKEVIKFSSTSIPENIEIHQNISGDEISVNGNTTQLHQVMLNLINNARDSLEGIDNPTITVKLETFLADDAFIEKYPYIKLGPYAHLSVEDNGCGIPEHQVEHLFEPFFTTKEEGKGTGLGLAMVFGAVKTHEGYIEVESTAGKGSIFHIYLPLLESIATPAVSSSDDLYQGQGETIMIVDDNDFARRSGREILESMNYKVLEASDGLEAIDVYTNNQSKVDLILIDLIMPRLGGVEAVNRIRNIHADVKVIYSTGYDKSEALKGALLDDDVLLSKPQNIKELSKSIREKLDS